MHGRDVVVTLRDRHAQAARDGRRRRSRAGGVRSCRCTARARPREKDRDLFWRIKAKTSEELRQEFLSIYVPRILELGLEIPDPELRFDEAAQTWRYARARLGRAAPRGHRPRPEVQERLEFRRMNHEQTAWVRDTVLAPRAAAA